MNLIVIEGKIVSRFDGRRLVEKREIDFEGMPVEARRLHIEYMRLNGFAAYDPSPSELAFARIGKELEDGVIRMERDAA